MRIAVLGGGRVGATIVRDLAASFDVTVADRDEAVVTALAERTGADGAVADLSKSSEVVGIAEAADVVVGAVPGALGFATARAVIEGARRPLVDISFFPEDAYALDAAARAAGVPALVDCGVAPGLSNLVLGRVEAELDEVLSFRCMVGGLPVERRWPWEYKAPFSPGDVIEEYTRPARLRRGGREITLPALSEVELVHIDEVGTLEAFNTDGLRTLLRTSTAPDLVEKTLRYPGHAERVRVLRDTGFFDVRARRIGSRKVIPRALSEALLFDAWRLEDGEPELTAMRIEIEGVHDGAPVRRRWMLLDRTDLATGTSSMARTTGYTCTAMVALVASGAWDEPGIAPPEIVGRRAELYEEVMGHLRARGVLLMEEDPDDVLEA